MVLAGSVWVTSFMPSTTPHVYDVPGEVSPSSASLLPELLSCIQA